MPSASMRLPADAAHAGPRVPARTNTEDSVTKHWLRVVEEASRDGATEYIGVRPKASIPATPHTLPAGFCWLINPVGASKKIAVSRIYCSTQYDGTVLTATSPRILLYRITFTGTSSAGAITPAQVRGADAAPTAVFTSANTGLTITVGADLHAFLPVAQYSSGASTPRSIEGSHDDWIPLRQEQPILEPGEGIGCSLQDTSAGTPRSMNLRIGWQEYSAEF